MTRGRGAPATDRGGGPMTRRTALAALAGATLLAAALALGAGRALAPVALLDVAGLAILVLALRHGRYGALALALLLLAAAYTVRLEIRHADVDLSAPLVAGALALVAELASWSLRARVEPVAERAVSLARARTAIALALGGTALAGLVLAAATLDVGSSPLVTVVGVVAVGVLLAGAAQRVRRPKSMM
jgi:hypothetical protein